GGEAEYRLQSGHDGSGRTVASRLRPYGAGRGSIIRAHSYGKDMADQHPGMQIRVFQVRERIFGAENQGSGASGGRRDAVFRLQGPGLIVKASQARVAGMVPFPARIYRAVEIGGGLRVEPVFDRGQKSASEFPGQGGFRYPGRYPPAV